jgi:hypothetical protein
LHPACGIWRDLSHLAARNGRVTRSADPLIRAAGLCDETGWTQTAHAGPQALGGQRWQRRAPAGRIAREHAAAKRSAAAFANLRARRFGLVRFRGWVHHLVINLSKR